MDKAYDHSGAEDTIYQQWETSGAMRANENSDKPSFTIPLPPPNVTGNLHLGHAAMLAIEDIMIRYKRMRGHEVLWIPGTDHAAIATENVVLRHLGAKSREEYSREEFLGHCRQFAAEKHDNIVNQMKRMGSWLDWSREAYTFDEARNHAVNHIFKDLYEDGLIERGHRLINWSVGAKSVISDDELEWDEVKEPFYYIRCGEFVIGTVRPETKCADSPVVVHPDSNYVRLQYGEETLIVIENLWNDREKFFKTLNFLDPEANYEVVETKTGKELAGIEFEYDTYAAKRKFYVLADEVIDPEKGAGAMTISASHSADDYDLAKRRDLKTTFIEKLDFEGKMTDVAGPCAGLPVLEARKKSGKLMKTMGLLLGQDNNYEHRVPLCYRSGSVVEPMISPQWFIMVEKEYTHPVDGKTTLKKQMQAAVREDHITIVPDRFNKQYFHWIDNLQDWCISRQIWWGHRIPVWYDEDGEIVATGSLSEEQKKQNLRQDEDTLDTWFSSALWPFSTLGWPDKEAADFNKFYQTDVMETGWDILFFWVARMIMFGRYATGKYPFHTVYLHGMVTDEHGKKMSKSKGNGIDPLDMIDQFGTDPVRLALVIGSTPGNPIPIGENKIKGYRNFVNKLWNAARFVQMQLDDVVLEETAVAPKSLADRWILSRLTTVSREVSAHLNNYEISSAGDKIYHFVWGEFCDWYLEASKAEMNPVVLRFVLGEILKLTHPLCPFITEKLWQELFEPAGSLMNEDFPALDFEDLQAEKDFAQVQNIVSSIRQLRAEKGLNPKEKIMAYGQISHLETEGPVIKLLANLSDFNTTDTAPESAVKLVVDGIEMFIDVPIDEAAEAKRVTKEKAELEAKIANLEGRLSNKSYTDKAPAHLVEQTRTELENAKQHLAQL